MTKDLTYRNEFGKFNPRPRLRLTYHALIVRHPFV
jgi:hypothetical protein